MLQETVGSTVPNLIGRSTTKELVSEAALVLGSGAILDPVAINTTNHTSGSTSIRYCMPQRQRGLNRTSP